MPMSLRDVRSAWVRRLAAAAAGDERAAREARAVLSDIVRLLVLEFGARRVVLFGSLPAGLFRADSDIDLAVEGIPPHCFLQALRAASLLAGRKVDLIDAADASPSLRERIAAEGEVLHVA